MKVILIVRKAEQVQECDSVFVKNLQFDEWHDCDENEYVKDGIVYEKVFTTTEKNVPYYFNPALNRYQKGSLYLDSVLLDEKVCWLANMVTYYRHTLPSWNKCWGENGHNYRSNWFGDYDVEKMIVNERQKRKIIKLHSDFLKENEITVNHFKLLKNTDEKTIHLAELKLNQKKRVINSIDRFTKIQG